MRKLFPTTLICLWLVVFCSDHVILFPIVLNYKRFSGEDEGGDMPGEDDIECRNI